MLFLFQCKFILGKEYMASLEEEKKEHSDSVCVKVNKTHHTTITAWQNPESDDHKEVILLKEVEMSNTYRIIGADQDRNVINSPKNIVEDNDSFYGSDKETDDIVMFSDDEGLNGNFEDCSSSDEEFINKVTKIYYYFICCMLPLSIVDYFNKTITKYLVKLQGS